MKKKIKSYISIGFFLLLIIAAGSYFAVQQSFLYDDYLVEDDFSIPKPELLSTNRNLCIDITPIASGWPSMGRNCQGEIWKVKVANSNYQPGDYTVRLCDSSYNVDGNYLTSTLTGTTVTYTYAKDLKNYDFKTNIILNPVSTTHGGRDPVDIPSYASVLINNIEVAKVSANSDETSFLIEEIRDIENSNIIHTIINGKEIGTYTVTGDTNYVSIAVTAGECIGSRTFSPVSSTVKIDYLKSRPYFNCKIDTDEVVIQDKFSAGSVFDIRSLTYAPVKFCVDNYPAIVRSFTAKGSRADVQGQLTKKLTTGQQITVAEDTEVEIYYIADYKEGMGLKCGLDSAYSSRLKKCIKIIQEEEDIAQFINEKEFISVGKDQITFVNSLSFPEITSDVPKYLCSDEDDKTTSPNVDGKLRPDCWTVDVTYNNKLYTLQYGEDISLDDYLNLKAFPQAFFKESKIQSDWKNNFILTLKNRNMLNVDNTQEYDPYLIFGKPSKLSVSVNNNYLDFPKSGMKVSITKGLLTSQTSEMMDIPFIKGKNSYELTLTNTEYGDVSYELVPYYYIGDEIFFDDEKVIRGYKVVDVSPLTELEEATAKLSELQLTLGEKASYIKQLTLTSKEQAALIAGLQITAKEKEALVQLLTTNEVEKQNLINQINAYRIDYSYIYYAVGGILVVVLLYLIFKKKKNK